MSCWLKEWHSHTRWLVVITRYQAEPFVTVHCGKRASGQRQEVVKSDTFKMDFVARLPLNSGLVGVACDGRTRNSVVVCGKAIGWERKTQSWDKNFAFLKERRLLLTECIQGARSSGGSSFERGFSAPLPPDHHCSYPTLASIVFP